MQETWVQSLGQEDLLEMEMASQSSILVWRIPWTEEPGVSESDTTEQLSTHMHTRIYKTNDNEQSSTCPPTHTQLPVL